MLPIALIPSKHEMLLSKFKEEVCRDPDADFAPRIAALADKFREQETKRFNGAFFMLLLELYEGSIPSLKRDLLKIRLLGTAKATPSQRIAILQCVYGIISLYIKDDFAGIIAICEDVEDAYRMEEGSPELDTWG